MAKNDNLKDFLIDLADAIREKKGISGPINPQDFSAEIASIEVGGGNGWTGHADAEGLRAIGWTDEDIAYYQENGVDWNEVDDHLHLVSDDNKALYGVLTTSNISTYKDRIVYLPKIDTSKLTNASSLLKECYYMVAVPSLDLGNIVYMASTFDNCVSLCSISPMFAPNAINLYRAFYNCSSLSSLSLTLSSEFEANYAFWGCGSLRKIESNNTWKIKTMGNTFAFCSSLLSIPTLDTSALTALSYSFYYCFALRNVGELNVGNVTSMSDTFTNCSNLKNVQMKNLRSACSVKYSLIFDKESLLYIINNEASTSAITITLATNVYDKYANDPDILSALANHPNITLAK